MRKRFIGDYNHAVLSTRVSGGNSARSMVYADGILLSNYLGNGADLTLSRRPVAHHLAKTDFAFR